MDAPNLATIDGGTLAWGLVLLATWIAVALGWFHLRRNHHGQLRAHSELARIARDVKARDEQALSLHNLINRQLELSLENRDRFRQLQRRLGNLEQQICQADAYRRAIGTARRGGALRPLIKRGDLNSAEAHLIQVVHGP